MADNLVSLKFMLDRSTNIFVETDSYARITFASTKAKYIFHNQQPEGNLLRDVFEPNTADMIENHIRNVLYQNYPETFLLEVQERYYNVFLYPYENKAVLCFEDITERRQLSHHLHQTRQRMEFAERTARLGYWELDLLAKKFYWSAEMYRIFGLDASKITTKRNLIREQIFAEDLPLYKEKITQLLKHGLPVEGQVRVRRNNGHIANCLFKASIIYDNHGERIAGTFQDITPLMEIQHALETARKHADSSNLAKSYFLAQASHDLRQPMQALTMFIAALNEDKLSPCQADIVSKISASADNLKSLLDNLLDISKLDSGGMDYEVQQFDVAELLNKLCVEYHQLAQLKDLKIKCRFQSVVINSDPLLIERIVRNLLSNAFKYAKNKIILSCQATLSGVKIMVLDNGVGIKDSEIIRIFDEFYQSKDVPDNRRMGAGLGLNIVKKIAGILNGEITVKSRFGHYTAFTLWLHR